MTIPIPCYSRKRKAWVIYDRPSRREALAHATATMLNNECIPMVWTQQAGAFATKAIAEAAVQELVDAQRMGSYPARESSIRHGVAA